MSEMTDLNASRPLSRRQFLARTAATTAGIAFSGMAQADDKKPPKPKIIVGTGEYQYECIHDWLMPPDTVQWGDAQGVAQDSKGHIYVTQIGRQGAANKSAIVVFSHTGQYMRCFGERFNGGGHGLQIRKEDGEEYIYHCDTTHRNVVKMNLEGKVVWEKGVPKESGKYNNNNPFVPTNVAFSPNGDFYITDGYGSDWIHQYDIKGNYIRSFGGRGTAPGQFVTAHGIQLDRRGSEPLLVVTDRGTGRYQYLSLDGKHVRSVYDGMRQPCNFGIRKQLMVVPDLKSVVTLMDNDDKIIVQLGDGNPSNLRGAAREQFIPGKFIHPHDCLYLKNGDILIAEYIPIGRISLLKKMKH